MFAERLDGFRRAEHPHGLLPSAHFRATAWNIDAGAAQGVVDLRRGEAQRFESLRFQRDIDLAVDATHALDLRDTGLRSPGAGR